MIKLASNSARAVTRNYTSRAPRPIEHRGRYRYRPLTQLPKPVDAALMIKEVPRNGPAPRD